jgi:hypothetical protein
LGKVLRDGDVDSTLIESLRPGDLVLTHCNRMMPVLEVVSRLYTGEMLEVEFSGVSKPLYITPHHPVAGVAPALRIFMAQVSTARHMTLMWSLLRNRWRKVVPRPVHIESKQRDQEDLKKTSQNS